LQEIRKELAVRVMALPCHNQNQQREKRERDCEGESRKLAGG